MNHLLFNKKSRKKNKALSKEKNRGNINTNFIKINCNIKNKGKCLSILYFYLNYPITILIEIMVLLHKV
jgi:hypothetical protein